MNELVSIIMPAYNVENFIGESIKSILNQTYKHLELIIVNDGSTDTTEKIIKKYMKEDNRIRLINKVNGGLSSARNCGLKVVDGKYIFFIDSDDWIADDTIETMLNILKEKKLDLVQCGFCRCFDNNTRLDHSINLDVKIYTSTDAIKSLYTDEKINVQVWNKLYKKEIIGNITFEEGKLYEDMYFTYKILDRSSKIGTIEIQKYFYRINSNSITNNININAYINDYLGSYNQILNFIIERDLEKDLLSSVKVKYIKEIYYLILNKYEQISNVQMNWLKNEIDENFEYVKSTNLNKRINIYIRHLLCSNYLGIHIYRFFRKINYKIKF